MAVKRTCSGVNRVFLLILFFMMVVPLLFGRLFLHMDTYDGTVFTAYLYLIPILLYVAATRGRCLEDIPFATPRISILLLVLLFTALLLPIMAWINLFSMMFSENFVAQEMAEMSQESLWKNILFIALLPAVAEEYAMRGVMFHGYRKAGVLKGAVVSGLLFGLMHLNINQFCYAAVIGIVFALLVEASGSIFYSMAAHFAINLNSVLLMNAQAASGLGRIFAGRASIAAETVPVSGAALRGISALEMQASGITRDEMLLAWTFDTLFALAAIFLARLVFIWIAKRSGRWEHMQAVFRGTEHTDADPGEYRDRLDDGLDVGEDSDGQFRRADSGSQYSGTESNSQYSGTEPNSQYGGTEPNNQYGGTEFDRRSRRPDTRCRYRVVTPSLVVAVACGAAYMILAEWIM